MSWRAGWLSAVILAAQWVLSPAVQAQQQTALTPLTLPQQQMVMRHYAFVQQVKALRAAGRLTPAIRAAEEALADARQPLLADRPKLEAGLRLESLQMCGEMYMMAGNEEQALAMYTEGLAMYRPDGPALPLKIHLDLVKRTTYLYYKRQQPQQAIAMLERAMQYPGMDFKRDPFLLTWFHYRLGRAQLQAGDYPRAEKTLLLALDERAAVAGYLLPVTFRDTPDTPRTDDLSALANRYQQSAEVLQSVGQGLQMARSDGVQLQGLDTDVSWARVDTAASRLAQLYFEQGQADALEKFYRGPFADYAQRMRQRPSAEGDIDLEMEYASLGARLAALARPAAADDAIRQALRLNAQRLQARVRGMTPDLLSTAFATRRALVGLWISQRIAAAEGEGADWRPVVGELMQAKALVNVAQMRRAALLRQTDNPDARRLLEAMDGLDPNAAWASHVSYLNHDFKLQGLLAPKLAPLELSDGAPFLARVQQALADERLVSISVYQPVDLHLLRRQPERYLGVALSARGLKVLDLGPVAALDATLVTWRAELAAADTQAPASSALAYQTLLAPLLGPRLSAGRYIAEPDGPLAQLPFEAMRDASGDYLISHTQWRYISSVRQLLEPALATPQHNTAVVLGNPDFDSALPPVATAAVAAAAAATPVRPVMRQLRFARLPGSEREMHLVAAALQRTGTTVELRTGAQASTAYLRSLHGPRYLHLATHGFYLGPDAYGSEDVRAADGNSYRYDLHLPYFDGGLALAGANQAPTDRPNQGVLFSSQLRQLDLEGTELVVLSACYSGAGAAASGEAADSLRQALEVAGARSTVSALWRVDDQSAADLMDSFYRHLASGADKGWALQQAKLDIQKRWPHPFYWSSFILGGSN